MTTKLVVPPMPEVYTEADTEAQLDAVRVYRLDELRAYARTGWQTAQREAALVDDLAEALEDQECRCHFEPIDGNWAVVPPTCTRCAALAKHAAARQMNKEARNG